MRERSFAPGPAAGPPPPSAWGPRRLAPWGDAQLWRLDLDRPVRSDERALLSAEEAARAGRFVFDLDRRRFEAAHVDLRLRLGAVLGIPPGALHFSRGPYGKPAVEAPCAGQFNLSHSEATGALLWLPGESACGVDVERRRSVRDRDAVAAQVFTAAECGALAALDADRRDDAFLRLWTRKEAVIKALGTGLSLPPTAVPVGLEAGDRRLRLTLPKALAAFGTTAEIEVVDLDLGDDVVAAAALRVDGHREARS